MHAVNQLLQTLDSILTDYLPTNQYRPPL